MPNYVQKNLIKYKHEKPKRPQHCPYEPALRRSGKAASETMDEKKSLAVNDYDKKKSPAVNDADKRAPPSTTPTRNIYNRY